jgi:hypothetical protein
VRLGRHPCIGRLLLRGLHTAAGSVPRAADHAAAERDGSGVADRPDAPTDQLYLCAQVRGAGATPHVRSAYAELGRLGICSGAYPKRLLDEWDRFAATKRSENDRPGTACRRHHHEEEEVMATPLTCAGTQTSFRRRSCTRCSS